MTGTEEILSTQELHKRYGRITALNKVSLTIKKGQVFGLLGPNGSGKTTALGMILGVTNPTSGSYRWFGKDDQHEHRKNIGAILEKPNFYTAFNAQKNLEIAAHIKEAGVERIPSVLKQVGLFERKDDPFQTYSLGMKQRLAIASALLTDPDVLILDEPTNGLDPQGILEMRNLILEISRTGKTIILASHLLDEVQKVCSHFAVLKKGDLIYSGEVDASLGEFAYIEVGAEDLNRLEELIKVHPLYEAHKPLKGAFEIKLSKGAEPNEINTYFMKNDVVLSHLVMNKQSLEQQFLEILKEQQ
ncbi:MAG: ATP-binding cassette domain-containing protein [Bacteroidota bacterium]